MISRNIPGTGSDANGACGPICHCPAASRKSS